MDVSEHCCCSTLHEYALGDVRLAIARELQRFLGFCVLGLIYVGTWHVERF